MNQPGMNGIETAKVLMQLLPNCRIILFSGQATSVDPLSKAGAEDDILSAAQAHQP